MGIFEVGKLFLSNDPLCVGFSDWIGQGSDLHKESKRASEIVNSQEAMLIVP